MSDLMVDDGVVGQVRSVLLSVCGRVRVDLRGDVPDTGSPVVSAVVGKWLAGVALASERVGSGIADSADAAAGAVGVLEQADQGIAADITSAGSQTVTYV